MAATMQVVRAIRRCSRLTPRLQLKGVHRNLLSEAYQCNEEWVARLQSPLLSKIPFSEYAVKLYEKYESEGQTSLIDIDILANKLYEMHPDEEYLAETILKRYRASPTAIPVNDVVNHAIIRSYIHLKRTDRLIELMKNKWEFGIFPDSFAACLIMDHLIKLEDYKSASQVAYELMLQEDFNHKLSRLLSLYACVKYLQNGFSREYLPSEPEDKGEEEWIAVKLIRNHYYDDHFEIKDERFLMGKTLSALGRTVDGVVGRSLQLAGMALHDKYSAALVLLQGWLSSETNNPVVNQEAVDLFAQCLEEAPVRDPEEKMKDFGLRTMDDEINLMKMTPEEKEKCQASYQELLPSLQKDGRITSDRFEDYVENVVKAEIPKHESADIERQQSLYKEWNEQRTVLMDDQVNEYIRKEKEREIVAKLKELQEQEEMLTYFDNEQMIKNLSRKKSKSFVKDTTALSPEDEYVEAPADRVQKKKK